MQCGLRPSRRNEAKRQEWCGLPSGSLLGRFIGRTVRGFRSFICFESRFRRQTQILRLHTLGGSATILDTRRVHGRGGAIVLLRDRWDADGGVSSNRLISAKWAMQAASMESPFSIRPMLLANWRTARGLRMMTGTLRWHGLFAIHR